MMKTLPALALILATQACSFDQKPAPYVDRGDERFSRSNSVLSQRDEYIYNPQTGSDFSSSEIESQPLDNDFVPYNRSDEVIDFSSQQQNSNNYSGFTTAQNSYSATDYIDAPTGSSIEYALAEPAAPSAKPIIENPPLQKPSYSEIEKPAPTLTAPATRTGEGYLDLSSVNQFNASAPASTKLSGVKPRSKPSYSAAEPVSEPIKTASYSAPKPVIAKPKLERHEKTEDFISVPKPLEAAIAPPPSIEPVGNEGYDVIERSPIIEKAKPESLQRLFARPVEGEIIGNFGNEADGTFNDGIKIRAAKGSEVHAADSGEVVYSGNQLQGYGNMVIIRHASGYLTSYAHLEGLDVKKGEKISKGEGIGKVGDTGNVSEPQLHFGVREGREPVDPKKFL